MIATDKSQGTELFSFREIPTNTIRIIGNIMKIIFSRWGVLFITYYMKNQSKISSWHVFAVPMGINGLSLLLVQAKYFKIHIRSNICDLWHALAHQNWHKCHVRHHLFLSRQRIIDHLKPNTSAGHLYICVSFIFYVWTYICILDDQCWV